MIARMTAVVSHCRRIALAAALLLSLAGMLAAAPNQTLLDLNFANAEISMVMKSLAEMGRVNIVVSPDVKGVVSLKLTGVTIDQAMQIVTSMTGCSFTRANGVYLVTKADGGNAIDSLKPKEYAIIKLKVASPADVISALGVAYADLQVKALADQRLIISGDEQRLKAARAFINEIDVLPVTADIEEKHEAIYQVKAVVPRQAKFYVEDLYRGQGLTITFAPNHRWQETPIIVSEGAKTAAAGDEPSAPVVSSQPWESDTLIIRGPKPIVEQAVASLKKIDISVPQSEKRVGVKRIYATQAISYLLGQFEARGLVVTTAPMTYTAGGEKSSATGINPGVIGTRVIRDKNGKLNISEPVGDFILTGSEAVVNEAVATLVKIDVGPERVERIVTLRFLHVGETQAKLTELYGAEGLRVTIAPSQIGNTPAMASTTGESSGTKTVTADQALLKVFDLVLSGPSDVVGRAVQLVEMIDVESTQISIQSEIISIDANETKKLGIEWPSSVGVNMTEIQSNDALRLGRILRDPITLNATINALQTKDKAKVISRPSTVVQNGREAIISVGDKLLYERVSSYDNGVPVYTTIQVDAGVTLQVIPQMSRDGVITLGITSVISNLTGFRKGQSGAELPQISETKSATTVQIKDGETLVIGGLMQNRMETSRKSVPVIGDLPLIGPLFSSKTTTPSNKELLIIVTPRVVKPQPAVTTTGTTAAGAPAN